MRERGDTPEVDVDPSDLLRDAQQLVERGWTQHADSRSADGDEVEPWSPNAQSWSLLGAIVAASERLTQMNQRDLPLEQLEVALDELAKLVDNDSLAAWNDESARTQREVVETLAAAGRSASLRLPPPPR
jgi:hypothetical protein